MSIEPDYTDCMVSYIYKLFLQDFQSMITPVLANVGEVDVASLQVNQDEVSY